MLNNTDKCIDSRGEGYLKSVFDDIAKAMGCKTTAEASVKLAAIVSDLELKVPENVSEKDIDILKNSVNPVRLKNHPIELTVEKIETLYREILNAWE
jgi:alcohol dehydrogenase class IV